MQEELISLETAKLAQEKGFNWDCNIVFDLQNNNEIVNFRDVAADDFIEDCKTGYRDKGLNYFIEDYKRTDDNTDIGYYVTRPSQSLLQKWLRDIHKIHIELQLSRNEDEEYNDWWFYLYSNNGGRCKYFPCEIGEGLSYEEALEIGLQTALNTIVSNEK
jgi:hypothetical protein